MSSIYVTGDIHGDPLRLSDENFSEQKRMKGGQENNFVIICGDFGLVWDQVCESKNERYLLNWLEHKSFTTLWIDGNHENFDRLYSSEYPIEEWNGGKVQKIRPHVIHLMRGEIYEILGHTFFTFGGARSHDICDGILEPNDYVKIQEFSKCRNKLFRVNHLSWWKEEVASTQEMAHGIDNLKRHDNTIDFIISHCLPQNICAMISYGAFQSDPLTLYFDKLASSIQFQSWICGHYHCDEKVFDKFNIVYQSITRIV